MVHNNSFFIFISSYLFYSSLFISFILVSYFPQPACLHFLMCVQDAGQRRRLVPQREPEQRSVVEPSAERGGVAVEDPEEGLELVGEGGEQVGALGDVPAMAGGGEDLLVRVDQTQLVPAQHARQIWGVIQRRFLRFS